MTEPLFDLAPDFSATEWRFHLTNHATARLFVEPWHYSHRMPGGGTVAYAAFAPDMVCCVMLSNPNNVWGVAGKLGLDGKHGNREISRVIAHPDAPKNTASRAIAGCMRLWRREGTLWVFSYADLGQNHHGGIYQALNAIYLGVASGRAGFFVDGEPMHPRSVVARFGTQAWPYVIEAAKAQGSTIERVDDLNTPKHLYVLPCGSPAQNRAIRRQLADRALPYPKRDDAPAVRHKTPPSRVVRGRVRNVETAPVDGTLL